MMIACLGPEGSYSWKVAQAAAKESGGRALPITTEFLEFVVQPLIRGSADGKSTSADAAVLAMYNSKMGDVQEAFDIIYRYDLKIHAAYKVSVDLALGHAQGSSALEVYSHPKALQQCMDWLLENYPDITPVAVGSTSAGVKRVAEISQGFAIADRPVLERSGLEIIAEGINRPQPGIVPVTQFYLVKREESGKAPEEGKCYRTLLAITPHYEEPWLLDKMFSILRMHGLNKGKIHSRPAIDACSADISESEGIDPQTFYLEIIGHKLAPEVRKCFEELSSSLKQRAGKNDSVRVLGSYEPPVLVGE